MSILAVFDNLGFVSQSIVFFPIDLSSIDDCFFVLDSGWIVL